MPQANASEAFEHCKGLSVLMAQHHMSVKVKRHVLRLKCNQLCLHLKRPFHQQCIKQQFCLEWIGLGIIYLIFVGLGGYSKSNSSMGLTKTKRPCEVKFMELMTTAGKG